MRTRTLEPLWYRKPVVIASGISVPFLLALALYLMTR